MMNNDEHLNSISSKLCGVDSESRFQKNLGAVPLVQDRASGRQPFQNQQDNKLLKDSDLNSLSPADRL